MANQITLQNLLNSTNENNVTKITDTIFEINNEVIEVLSVIYDTKELKIRHNHSTHDLNFKNNKM